MEKEISKKETLEEAYDRIFDGKLDRVLKAGFIAGAQCQQERSYSEEDLESVYRMALICGAEPYFIIWFEQFKKK